MSIIDTVICLYSSKNRKKILNKLKYYYLRMVVAKVVYRMLLPFISSRNSSKHKKEENLIVSLTSFPNRIENVWQVIESMLHQDLMPEKIILWLSKEQFRGEYEDLPRSIKKRLSTQFEVRFVDENLMSHKKFYYVMQEYPEHYIVTIDDDLMYDSQLLRRLYETSRLYGNAVVCNYARSIRYSNGVLLPYNLWPLIESVGHNNIISHNVFFGSGGGTIFPPKSLYRDTLDKDLFMKLTPRADDVWLNAMCRLQGTPIICLVSKYNLFPVSSVKGPKLANDNLNNNYNDIQINRIIEHYKKNIFIEK